jgi:hypothetical protein
MSFYWGTGDYTRAGDNGHEEMQNAMSSLKQKYKQKLSIKGYLSNIAMIEDCNVNAG